MRSTKREYKPEPTRLMDVLMDNVLEVYTNDCKENANDTAAQLEMSLSRVKKLLITAGMTNNLMSLCTKWSKTLFYKQRRIGICLN